MGLADFWWKNTARLYVTHSWAERIECDVIREDDGYLGLQEVNDTADAERDEKLARPNLVRLKRLARLLFARRPISQAALDALLACPACRGPLTRDGEALCCSACERLYPVKDGIPWLLLANGVATPPITSTPTVSTLSNAEAAD